MHVTIDLEGTTLAHLRNAVAGFVDLPGEATFVVTTARPGHALRGHGHAPLAGPTRFGVPLAAITATTPRDPS